MWVVLTLLQRVGVRVTGADGWATEGTVTGAWVLMTAVSSDPLSWGLIMTVFMHLFPQHLTLRLTCRRCSANACTSLWGPWVAATPDGQNFLTARRLSSPRARDMDYTCVCFLNELIIYLQCLILFKQTWPHWCPRLFPCQSGPGIKEAQRHRETSHCPPRTVL